MFSELPKRIYGNQVGRAEWIILSLIAFVRFFSTYSFAMSFPIIQESKWLAFGASPPLKPLLFHHRTSGILIDRQVVCNYRLPSVLAIFQFDDDRSQLATGLKFSSTTTSVSRMPQAELKALS
jgi:hypothetical protein